MKLYIYNNVSVLFGPACTSGSASYKLYYSPINLDCLQKRHTVSIIDTHAPCVSILTLWWMEGCTVLKKELFV